jgi:hypothetical protein
MTSREKKALIVVFTCSVACLGAGVYLVYAPEPRYPLVAVGVFLIAWLVGLVGVVVENLELLKKLKRHGVRNVFRF